MSEGPIPESGEHVARITGGELTELANSESGRKLYCEIPEEDWEDAVDDTIDEVVIEPVSS
jgi:hypothetical protein